MNLRRWRRLFSRRVTPWVKVKSGSASIADDSGPPLSIVLITYNMPRQTVNTLRSLIPPYQQQVNVNDYEIWLMDNGSQTPMTEAQWNIAPNIRYQYIPPHEASA